MPTFDFLFLKLSLPTVDVTLELKPKFTNFSSAGGVVTAGGKLEDFKNQNLHSLISVAYSRTTTTTTTTESTQDENDEQILRPLLNRVVRHYELYYREKSRWAKQDGLFMFSPSWRSTLEDVFLWIKGWRPSMAFHLLYSKSRLQLEDHLSDLIRGLSISDLANLSAIQLNRVNELQRRAIREEKDLIRKLSLMRG